jgi:hypothetical protein
LCCFVCGAGYAGGTFVAVVVDDAAGPGFRSAGAVTFDCPVPGGFETCGGEIG